jgi:drug/metabolite transporter (DMT)-like permease
MTPRRLIGLLLVVAGLVIVALRGVSYTRERHSVEIGNVELAAERKGFVHPVVGLLLLVVGGGLVFYPARKS